MRTGTRKFITKELQQDADQYTGESGEIWFQEGTQTVRFGDDVTPGGILIRGGLGIEGDTVTCLPNQHTVIFTATTTTVRTLKVLAQAEGYETGVIDYPDTQSAEIMAIKNLRTGLGVASVYGVTYTSANPLVTFDAEINGSGFLQVTAQPVSGTNSVDISTIAFEIEQV